MARASREQIQAWFDQACRLHAAGAWEEAEGSYSKILAANPRHVDARYLHAGLLAQKERFAEAIAELKQVLAIIPYHADAHATMGEALLGLNQLEEAIASLEQALTLKPEQPGPFINLGNAWQRRGDIAKALACFVHAIHLQPTGPRAADAHFNVGNLLRDGGQIDAAIACYKRAIALRPDFSEAQSNLGYSYKHCGRLDEAVAAFREALRLRPEHAAIQSGLAFLVQFQEGVDAAGILAEQVAWARRHAEPLAREIQPHDNERSMGRRLRVGYVSPDFRNHCQSFFTIPLLAQHDHGRVEVFCYADVAQPDAATARLGGYADVWRSTAGCSDARVAEMIRADQIDVLVDLTMHMARNRLGVFARKPAPVQVTWLAYPGTTGLSTMDYRLSDNYLDPPENRPQAECYSERTVRLPDSFWCYDPLTREPPVNALPALEAGHVTFGCLNNFCKVNPGVVRLWAKVLNAVPGSRIIILCAAGSPRDLTLERFRDAGVAGERIEFVDAALRKEYLEYYHRIDLVLDTVPYNGHTTSLDGLWMGVPMVTLVGQTVVGRAGLCQLMNLGMPDFVGWNQEDYVRIAVAKTGDLAGLATIRSELRGRMEGSALMDGSRFARNVEAAYREMWAIWCKGS